MIREIAVYNPQKGRYETINIAITNENTTWFDYSEENESIYMITDFNGCLVIADFSFDGGHNYPFLIYDITREDINFDYKKALELKNEFV